MVGDSTAVNYIELENGIEKFTLVPNSSITFIDFSLGTQYNGQEELTQDYEVTWTANKRLF